MRRAAWLLLSELAGLPLLVTAFAIVSDGARRSPGARARRRRLQEGHGARGAQAAGWCWPGSRHVGAADPLGEGRRGRPESRTPPRTARDRHRGAIADPSADAQPADDLEEDATSLFFVHRLMPIGVNETPWQTAAGRTSLRAPSS
ncbi:unnamed protein product [Prorocentrum cordatum]|uniref:Uncharacterized protein n=1 Tax=Prorocentrum cordatum TaxID=2364126 RepID=A0ABN9T9T7_9DINO|nr:unnamed protein product [Polarella glacialis]